MDLDLDDDIALPETTKSIMTKNLDERSNNVRLWINANKTKNMKIGYTTTGTPAILRPDQIEGVQRFTYLDSVITNNGDAEHDIACQTGKAGAVFR